MARDREFVRIRNWTKWQTYRKDRGQPPWIKIHREVMRNYEWLTLTDAQRGQLVCLWILAADRGGCIPANPAALRKVCSLDTEPDLELFEQLGFIEPDGQETTERRQHDANLAPSRRQADAPEEEAEAEAEGEGNAREAARPPAATGASVFPPSSCASCPSKKSRQMLTDMATERGLNLAETAGAAGVPLPITAGKPVSEMRAWLENQPRLTSDEQARRRQAEARHQRQAELDETWQRVRQLLQDPPLVTKTLAGLDSRTCRVMLSRLDAQHRETFGSRYLNAVERSQGVGMGEAAPLRLEDVEPVLAAVRITRGGAVDLPRPSAVTNPPATAAAAASH